MLADVVVSASTEPEGFGRAVIEGQAMARPVIATDHGGAAETVEHGVTGWRVPPGDPVALAAAIDDALALEPGRAGGAWGAGAGGGAARATPRARCRRRRLAVYRELPG